MQLQPPSTPTPPPDLATGLATCARERGQRPAVTALSPAGRSEQGFVTLAQWAAKGAHLLQTDLDLAPGDRVLVDVPPGWTLAAVCAAVWWVGGTVVVPGPGVEARDTAGGIVHEGRPLPDAPEVYVVGDAVDGGTTVPTGALVWAEEVQAFPDHPPAPAAAGSLPALEVDGRRLTHDDVVARFAADRGVLGVDRATFTGDGVLEVAARPLVTGRATVVLHDVDHAAADGDRVGTWA